MHRLIIALVTTLLLALPARAQFMAQAVELRTHNPEAASVLNQALTGPGYWSDASESTYNNKMYDRILLKNLPSGYLMFISGEGDQDFRHEVVADIVFSKQTQLPKYTEGARAVVTLGTGFDPVVGAPYTDTFFFLDMTVFYGVYSERMYRQTDEQGRTVLWYEKLDPAWVDAATWAQYQTRIAEVTNAVDRRWAFNDIVPVSDIYGMFIVHPGDTRKSRVTFITTMMFDAGSGWVARFGSQLPPVMKAGLKSGFVSCVEIARAEQRKREKREAEEKAREVAPPTP